MHLVALTTAEELLTKYGEFFEKNNIIVTALRSILWFFLVLIKDLIDIFSGILGAAYKLLTFDFSSLDKFVQNGTVVNTHSFSQTAFVGSLTILVLLGIGLAMILGSENIKGTVVIRNILFGILVIAIIPSIMTTINSAFANSVDIDDVPLGSIFKSNTYDLQYICTTGEGVFKSDTGQVKINNFPDDNDDWINQISIGEVIKGTEVKGIDEVFLKKLEYKDGVPTVVESTFRGELPFGIYFEPLATDYYYRYSVDMLPIFLAEISTLLVVIFTTLKVARLSYELVIHRVFAQLLALTDIAGGTRLREVIKAIGATYIVLAYCPVALRIFLSFQEWMFGVNSPFDNNIIPAFFLLAIALAVIDGPNLIERIFNIDAGIQSGFKTAMTAIGIGKVASGAAHGLSHGIKSAKNAISSYSDKPSLKDKRSALRSSRAAEYASGYIDGEKTVDDIAEKHGSSKAKTQEDKGKENGIRHQSKKKFTNAKETANQIISNINSKKMGNNTNGGDFDDDLNPKNQDNISDTDNRSVVLNEYPNGSFSRTNNSAKNNNLKSDKDKHFDKNNPFYKDISSTKSSSKSSSNNSEVYKKQPLYRDINSVEKLKTNDTQRSDDL